MHVSAQRDKFTTQKHFPKNSGAALVRAHPRSLVSLIWVVMAAVVHAVRRKKEKERQRQIDIFQSYDKDGSGGVTRTEYTCRDFSPAPSPPSLLTDEFEYTFLPVSLFTD